MLRAPIGNPAAKRRGSPVDYDLLHVNPGAAGEYGFHKVRTAVRLVIDGADMRDMEVGEWPRK